VDGFAKIPFLDQYGATTVWGDNSYPLALRVPFKRRWNSRLRFTESDCKSFPFKTEDRQSCICDL
jgi:hypothetical protein